MAASKKLKQELLLEFKVAGKTREGVKNVWEVYSISNNSHIGTIRWYDFWRKFQFYPAANNIFSTEVLHELSLFMKQKTEERQDAK